MTEEEAETLRRDNAALRAQLTQVLQQVAALNDRVAELLSVAQRKRRVPATEKPPAPPPAVGPAEKRAFNHRPSPPEKPASEPREKKPRRPTGRKPVPQHLEPEQHALRPDACGHCGSTALDAAEELVEEKLHVVKEHQRRRFVRRTTCPCRSCGGRTTRRSLPAPYERSKVTCEWLA